MNKNKNAFLIFISFAMLFVLIVDPKSVVYGARQGIDLCLKTLIPALFPFMVITEVCGALLPGLQSKALRKLMKPCKLPEGSEIIYILGLVSGYPIGAKLISDAYNKDLIKKNDAKRMLMFCSNAGPSFIFGIIGPMFSQPFMPWIIWEIHILSSFLVGIFIPKAEDTHQTSISAGSFRFSKVVPSVVRTTGNICGWVVLFRIILTFSNKWFLRCFPAPIRALFSGVLEISNGCLQLTEIENVHQRFIITVLLLTFGGLCVTMQTASFVPAGTVRYYLSGKLYQSLVALILSIPIIVLIDRPFFCLLVLPLCCLLLSGIRYIGKSSKKQ